LPAPSSATGLNTPAGVDVAVRRPCVTPTPPVVERRTRIVAVSRDIIRVVFDVTDTERDRGFVNTEIGNVPDPDV